ncbi:MAG: Electron transport complex subunit RsxA [Gammaproteobacteria bacterium]|nr:MAG: Electron transport complex subunit RsxA [Gammaproteobacteria bacterium]
MTDLLLIITSAALVNNFVLVQFLGLCPFMGVSSRIDSALGMSCATTFVLTLSSVVAYLLQSLLLIPLDVMWLRTLAFIVAIAVAVQFTELAIKKTSPLLHSVLGIYLPLITTNCAVLGVALLNTNHAQTLAESAFYGMGAALGFSLVLILFAGIRERLQLADIPAPFQGASIALITAGFMALAFMGFTGMIRL